MRLLAGVLEFQTVHTDKFPLYIGHLVDVGTQVVQLGDSDLKGVDSGCVGQTVDFGPLLPDALDHTRGAIGRSGIASELHTARVGAEIEPGNVDHDLLAELIGLIHLVHVHREDQAACGVFDGDFLIEVGRLVNADHATFHHIVVAVSLSADQHRVGGLFFIESLFQFAEGGVGLDGGNRDEVGYRSPLEVVVTRGESHGGGHQRGYIYN